MVEELIKKSQAAIGKRNRRAGRNFEVRVAKTIARAFGWDWKKAFDRAGVGHEQSHDAITLSPFSEQWSFWWEAKYRQGWDMHQFFKNPHQALAYRWFKDAIENTAIDNLFPAMALSAPHKPLYWMVRSSDVDYRVDPMLSNSTTMQFIAEGESYELWQLEDFLKIWIGYCKDD